MARNSRKPSPSNRELEIAMDWLDCNNGDDGEADACKAVVVFLQAELDRRLERYHATEIAKTYRVSLARAYALLRKVKAQKELKQVIGSVE